MNMEKIIAAIEKTEVRLQSLSAARTDNNVLIRDAVRKAGRIAFSPSVYWKGRTDITEGKAVREALVEESFGIDYSPDGDSDRKGGFISELSWDQKERRVLVKGIGLIADGEGEPERFTVPSDWVEDNENILRFIVNYSGAGDGR